MKLIGFAQLRNEISKGNLENWFKCMQSICDYIYIYDQNSDDGSKEYYKNFNNTFVIESTTNDFSNEIGCKKILLKKLLEDHPDADWIFWMDGDTLLEKAGLDRSALEKILLENQEKGVDGLKVGHYNLWRSDLHYRVDNYYHWLHGDGVLAFWKNNGKLLFPDSSGLHTFQYPSGIENVARIDLNLIHKGFSTDKQIIDKYKLYKKRGQTGWALDRLLDEETLEVRELNKNIFPSWFKASEIQSPITKNKLKDGQI